MCLYFQNSGRLEQDNCKFKASLGNLARSCLRIEKGLEKKLSAMILASTSQYSKTKQNKTRPYQTIKGGASLWPGTIEHTPPFQLFGRGLGLCSLL